MTFTINRALQMLLFVPTLVACQKAPDPMLQAPIAPIQTVTQSSDGLKVKFNPQVDILFVIDNSWSMKSHQENLSANINNFVYSLTKNGKDGADFDEMDLHIGAMSVYDSVTYAGLANPSLNFNQGFYPMGYLRPLRNAKGEVISEGLPFITRETPDFENVLKASLMVGALPLNKKNPLESGPEYEEMFSPIVSFLSDETRPLLPLQQEFLRPGAHFVAILVTDAPDSSRFTASQLDEFLRMTRNDPYRETFTLLAMLPHKGQIAHPEAKQSGCPYDPAGPPTNILELMKISHGHTFDLCNRTEMSKALAEMGDLVRKRTIKKRIELGNNFGIPELNTIEVTYAGKPVPNDPENGWMLNPNDVSITVYGLGDNAIKSGGELLIKYRPVAMRGLKQGTAHSFKQ